jgi:hypothetical protein
VDDTEGTRVSRRALRDYFPGGGPGRRLLPLPEQGCIYVRNAKAGTSTITLWLHRIHTGDHEFTPRLSIHKENALPRFQDVGWDQVVRMLNGEAFRFSFVRDPVRRAESAYVSKVLTERPGKPWRGYVQRALGRPEDPGQVPSFEEFVTALELQEPIRMDAHWRPQHLNLMHGLVEYDFVGRLESFADDLARVRELAGLPDVPIEVRNVSTKASDSLYDGRPDLLRKVREVYARDLELYGY